MSENTNMKKCWRFRTSWRGKLILQRCVSYSYSTYSIVSDFAGDWRDATAKDLLIFHEEFKT